MTYAIDIYHKDDEASESYLASVTFFPTTLAGPITRVSSLLPQSKWKNVAGGAGIMKRWVQAGLAQADYIHMTSARYQMLGKILFDELERGYAGFHE